MKRICALALVLLSLCGCAAQSPETTEVPALPTELPPATTEPPGSYLPDSEPERLSGGALRIYSMEEETCYALAFFGDELLVFSGEETTALTLLAGENRRSKAWRQLDVYLHPEDPGFGITENGITYCDYADGSLVYLDENLQEVRRLRLPEDISGSPILSGNRKKLYYATAESIRVLDLDTGLDRLLKELAYPQQRLEGLCQKDSVLLCTISEADGDAALFLSAETGEQLKRVKKDFILSGWEDHYYLQRLEGTMTLNLYGTGAAAPRMLNPREGSREVAWLESQYAAVGVRETGEAALLDYYRLEDGLRSASLTLDGLEEPYGFEGQADTGTVYFLAEMPEQGIVLCRWDTMQSPTGDEENYTTVRYTLENPDTVGLELLTQEADALGAAAGVEVLFSADAAAVEPREYDLEPEYQVPVLTDALEQLEEILTGFPQGFFAELAGQYGSGPVKLCLVRSVTGSPESGSLEAVDGTYFQDGDQLILVLAVGPGMERSFFHELQHMMEMCIFSRSNAYDSWEKLNPKDFAYDLDYEKNLLRQGDLYLTGKSRAFIDTYSMSFPREDRARLLEYAATAGNEGCFDSNAMQAKLQALCRGIREAFGLEDHPEILPWEQYLKKPLIP